MQQGQRQEQGDVRAQEGWRLYEVVSSPAEAPARDALLRATWILLLLMMLGGIALLLAQAAAA